MTYDSSKDVLFMEGFYQGIELMYSSYYNWLELLIAKYDLDSDLSNRILLNKYSINGVQSDTCNNCYNTGIIFNQPEFNCSTSPDKNKPIKKCNRCYSEPVKIIWNNGAISVQF